MSKFITFLCALVLMVQFLESNGMSVDRRNGMINIAKQGFAICNTDGQDGLTWTEIKDCEVSDSRLGYQHFLESSSTSIHELV